MSNKTLYSQDGVDVKDEADFSSYAGSVCKQSYDNSPFVDVQDLSEGNFRGPRPVLFKNLPEGYMIEATTDSIGSKGILSDASGTYDQSAYDLIGMSSTDITRYGGVPLMFVNILDVVSVGEPGSEVNDNYKQLIVGLEKAAKEINLVLLKGETCQIRECIDSNIKDSENKFNWGGAMMGAYHKNKMITGNTVAAGQKIIALQEHGFRCNGISSVRKAFEMKFGDKWWANPEAQDSLRQAARPTILYDMLLATLNGWYDPEFKPEIQVHALGHLSGGGIKEKFAHDVVLSNGLSATLDNLFDPPEIMVQCAKWRGIGDDEFYETWNGGQGMLVVVDSGDVDQFLARAKDFNINAQIAGEISEGGTTPSVTITSKLSGKEIVYE